MTLQYFVTASDTGNRIPIEVDKSTPADLAATKESWQTDWTSEFIGDPALEKYTAKTENGEIVALGAYRETESSMFVYIEYIESHPESNPTLTIQKKYLGIGRMMIAFGIQLSIDSGKNGVVTFEAKTDELAKVTTPFLPESMESWMPVKTASSLLKLRRMNLQNIISGILARSGSLPNSPAGRSC